MRVRTRRTTICSVVSVALLLIILGVFSVRERWAGIVESPASVTRVINGVPVDVPELLYQDHRVPLVSWQWTSLDKHAGYQMHAGSLPWGKITVGDAMINFRWIPSVTPNWVNVMLLRRRVRAGTPVTPQQIVATCSVNITYRTNHGCVLGPHGGLKIHWRGYHLSSHGGLVVDALWVPKNPRRHLQGSPANHQAMWIVGVR